MDKKKQLRGGICSTLGGICWGFTGVCAQNLFAIADVDSAWLATVRMIVAGTIMIVFGMIWNKPKEMTRIFHSKKDTIRLAIFGIAGLMFVQYTYFTAILYSNAGTATTLQYTCPIMIMVYTCLRKRQAPGWIGVISIIMVVFGVFLLACHGDIRGLAISVQGLIWGLLSAVAQAAYSIIPGDLIHRYGSLPITGFGMLIGGLSLGFVRRAWTVSVSLNPEAYLMIVIIILMGSILAYLIHMRGIADIGPMKATLFVSIEPVSAAFFSLIWMHTPLGLADAAGIVLVVAAVILYNMKAKQ